MPQHLVDEELPLGISLQKDLDAFQVSLDEGEVAPEDWDRILDDEQVDPWSVMLTITRDKLLHAFPENETCFEHFYSTRKKKIIWLSFYRLSLQIFKSSNQSIA